MLRICFVTVQCTKSQGIKCVPIAKKIFEKLGCGDAMTGIATNELSSTTEASISGSGSRLVSSTFYMLVTDSAWVKGKFFRSHLRYIQLDGCFFHCPLNVFAIG